MIVPFFITNRGCPHRCLFCNQEISGGDDPRGWGADYFHAKMHAFLTGRAGRKRPADVTQIAFYGGNFTGLPPEEQERLLDWARLYIENGTVKGIRISTRPDCLSDGDGHRLAASGVRTVEIGAQSLVDGVLAASRRGHTAGDVTAAVALLRQKGLEVILHLMAGLPGDDPATFAESVAGTAALRPDGVRLHPTLVLSGTPLAEEFLRGRYKPLSLPEAVEMCRQAWECLEKAGIAVIRLGLQASELLSAPGAVLAGPYHPAFGALVAAARWRERAFTLLAAGDARGRKVIFSVPAGEESSFRGHRNCNVQALKEHFRLASLDIEPGAGKLSCRCC